MPINATGAISLGASASTNRTNSVGSRLFVTNNAALDMNNATLRSLAGVGGSGTAYSLSNFYSKPTWAYTATYDCSSFTGWTTSVNTTGGAARNVSVYASIHWRFYADGNSVPYVWQQRNFGEATTFDIQFDYMMNTSAPQMQFQLASSTGLVGTGFRCTLFGLDYCSFSSSTDIGTAGGNLITWWSCTGPSPSPTLRQEKWTRIRLVGSRSGGTWSGTVSAIGLDPGDPPGTVFGTAAFSFAASGNGLVFRTFADNDGSNNDGSGTSLFIDTAWITLD